MEGHILNNLFLELMRWVYNLTAVLSPEGFGSVVLTITLCTLFLRALTIFSDIKTRKSSMDMAAIQPELQKIQKKYANDPRRAQVEQNKLMKERGVSMWGSCLPMLITMPLFFCFFAAFRYWGSEMTLRLLVDENAMGLFKSFRFLWINNIWQPDNGFMPVIAEGKTFLATADLSKLLYLNNTPGVWEKLVDIGIALKSVSGGALGYDHQHRSLRGRVRFRHAGIQDLYAGYNNGWFLMAILAGGTNFLSAWMMQKPAADRRERPDGQIHQMDELSVPGDVVRVLPLEQRGVRHLLDLQQRADDRHQPGAQQKVSAPGGSAGG